MARWIPPERDGLALDDWDPDDPEMIEDLYLTAPPMVDAAEDGWLDDYLDGIGDDPDDLDAEFAEERLVDDQFELVAALGDADWDRDRLGPDGLAETNRAEGVRLHLMTLRFPAGCRACHRAIPVGDEAMAVRVGERWLIWHLDHAPLRLSVAEALGLVGDGVDRSFVLQHGRPCSVCRRWLLPGEAAVGRKLDRGWDIRHPGCELR